MKRIFVFLLAVVMVLSMLPTTPLHAHATEAEEPEVEESTPAETPAPVNSIIMESRADTVAQIGREAKASANIVINGVDIGYANYDYFTKNRRSCENSYWKNNRCHKNDVCTEATHTECNCMRYWPSISNCQVDLEASQCFGFSRYCQWKLYGCHDGNASSKFKNLSGYVSTGNCTESTLKSYLLGCAPATHIRLGKNDNGHSITVVNTSASGIEIVECNYDGYCRIRKLSYTWAGFATEVQSHCKKYGYDGIGYINAWKDGSPGYFDFWSGEDGETISGKHTFWWKQDGYGTCDVNLDLNGKALGTIYPDENGLFSYTLDTTEYENGTYTLGAIIRSLNGLEKYVTRTIHIDNGSFGFWAGEDGETISATHTFWWKQTKYENCEVDLALNGNALGTIYPDASGLFSYALDTTKYENGTYTISATIRSTNKPEKTVSRTVHIDNGEATFGFWSGEDGETISAKHKFWWKQIGYESSEVDLEINGEALATRYPDENGLISYTLDTTQYENGAYTISATIRSANKPEKTVSRTVHIDNGDMFFGFWAGEDGETISGIHKFWWKQVGYGACEITITLNGEVLGTKTPDENGLISYTMDTTKLENGTYTISAKIRGTNGTEKTVSRTIRVNNIVPDDENGKLKGDVNLDGVVDMLDFVALARHIGEVEYIEDAVAASNADVNGDSAIDMLDFVLVAQYLGEVIDQL